MPTLDQMSTRAQWILYSIVRLALFGGVFAILMLLRVDLWIAGMAAAIIALCISYIFLKQPQAKPRPAKLDTDAVAEDAALADAEVQDAAAEAPDAAGQASGTPQHPLEGDRGSQRQPE
jgi:hypothetical protein